MRSRKGIWRQSKTTQLEMFESRPNFLSPDQPCPVVENPGAIESPLSLKWLEEQPVNLDGLTLFYVERLKGSSRTDQMLLHAIISVNLDNPLGTPFGASSLKEQPRIHHAYSMGKIDSRQISVQLSRLCDLRLLDAQQVSGNQKSYVLRHPVFELWSRLRHFRRREYAPYSLVRTTLFQQEETMPPATFWEKLCQEADPAFSQSRRPQEMPRRDSRLVHPHR